MSSEDRDEPEEVGAVTVTLEEGLWVVEDEETGISSQGRTKPEALRNLAEALETVEEGERSGDDWL